MKTIILGSNSFLAKELIKKFNNKKISSFHFNKRIHIEDLVKLSNKDFLNKYFIEIPNDCDVLIVVTQCCNSFNVGCFVWVTRVLKSGTLWVRSGWFSKIVMIFSILARSTEGALDLIDFVFFVGGGTG